MNLQLFLLPSNAWRGYGASRKTRFPHLDDDQKVALQVMESPEILNGVACGHRSWLVVIDPFVTAGEEEKDWEALKDFNP